MFKPSLVILVSLGLAAPAFGGAVTFVTRPPWDPAHMPVVVDQNQLQGPLSPEAMNELIEAGRQIFVARFSAADGESRPTATQALIPTHFKHPRELFFQRASGPDANSCESCHIVPSTGGAGDFTTNAFTSEGTESADFDSVDPQFSNERNPVSLFGAGLKELLAREMTVDLMALRDKALAEARSSGKPVPVDLVTKGVSFGKLVANPDGTLDQSGVNGIDDDLVLRPFSRKGIFTSLRQTSITVLNAHLGMEADERFGPALTGETDFDGDGKTDEVSPGQLSAVVAFMAALPPPVEKPFGRADWDAAAARGKMLFDQVGCQSCHTEALPLHGLKFSDPGPYDTAGTLSAQDVAQPAVLDLSQLPAFKALPRNADGDVMVPLFSDLKRHSIADSGADHFANEVQSQAFTARDTFLTPTLWGVADSAPWGHRGDLSTLSETILDHGGEGRPARDAFAALPPNQQNDLIAFLMTLKAPPP